MDPQYHPAADSNSTEVDSAAHISSRKNYKLQTWVGPFIFLSLVAVPLILFLLVAGIFSFYQTPGRIIPGVRVGTTNIGGMTITDAALKLQKSWNTDKQIILNNGIQSVPISPSEIGLSLDALKNIEQAYQVGHQETLIHRFGQFLVSSKDGWVLLPMIHFDENFARQGLENLTPKLSKEPRNASIQFDGGKLTSTPGEMGYTVNIQETIELIKQNPYQVMQDNTLQVALQPLSPQVSDLSPILGQVEQFINTPASFRAYDALSDEFFTFQIPKESLVSWITIEMQDQVPAIGLDQGKIQNSLQAWQTELGNGRFFEPTQTAQIISDAVEKGSVPIVIISHPSTDYTVQPGDTLLKIGWKVGLPYWKIVQANPGINPDKLLAGSVITIPSKDEMLTLPIVSNKRIVISIQKQRLWAYQDGNSINQFVISTGIDRSPTQPGIFQVQTHEKNAYASVWDLYMPNFLGIYEAWPGFMNGIHGLPTLSNGQRLWANILGKPASYGCIILDLDDAKWLYQWAEAGVVVEIQP